jgi:hypothetical protein
MNRQSFELSPCFCWAPASLAHPWRFIMGSGHLLSPARACSLSPPSTFML